MIEIFSAIDFIASTVSRTALPLSSASRDPFFAIDSVCLLLSAFCAIDAFICSRLAVVSCTAAACWLLPDDTDCAVDETCPAAVASEPAAVRTSPMISTRRPIIRDKACPSVSRSLRGMTVTPRSPAAMADAAETIDEFESIIFFIAARSCDVSSLPRISTR